METNQNFPLLDATRAFLAKPKKMLIGAEWTDAASGRRLDVVNPAVDLERLADGRNTWTFQFKQSSQPSPWKVRLDSF
ncbi:hypothetical protein DD788_31800, partial [Ralstonia pickettii]|nr:hypothetical protein [Ralstonia pickettii]